MPVPKWQALADDIRTRIRGGQLQPGAKLPSQAELCTEYGVSSIVVRNALLVLKSEGLIEGVPGVGVYVAEKPPE